MSFHHLVNTAQFSYTARDWKRNGGIYTRAPHGSREYFQFWEEEDRRCRYGYKIGDLYITGRHYGYLNHFPISKVPAESLSAMLAEDRDKNGNLTARAIEKRIGFPAFWEIDYEWWNFKDIAWYGGEFMGVESPGAQNICCLKTRGAGFSYKEAWDGIYNYNFIDGSKSYYFAASEPFLIGDAIMDKVQYGLDWINQYSPYWKKNRQKKFTAMHQRASYIDEFGVEKGTMSEIIAQIIDKPKKTRGKRGRKATFEEAGAFPHLEQALEVCMGSMRSGSKIQVGQISVFGTGGEQGPDIQGLENIFNAPHAWNMLAFPNIWETGSAGTECGYFVPCYRADETFMDADGNIDIKGALISDTVERNKKASSGKPKDLDFRKAEYPRTPSEALQRMTGNGFNIDHIDKQIKRIKTSTEIQAMLRYGRFTTDTTHRSGVDFRIMPKLTARPIEEFPHSSSGEDIRGCVTIVQPPLEDGTGQVPPGMYKISFDAYYKEEAEDTTSLFSYKVWKVDNMISPTYTNLPVAWYAGRPKTLAECYEQLFGAAKFYNAEIQGEISGGGMGVVTYAKTYRLLHYLAREPEMMHNKEVASKSAGNSVLMNMNADRKALGITYLEDWHMEPRGVNPADKSIIVNLDHVYDLAFLYEMRKFNPLKGNFDRISDAIVGMYQLKERTAEVLNQQQELKPSFFNRELFGRSQTRISGLTSAY
jgi:hypothetical protein